MFSQEALEDRSGYSEAFWFGTNICRPSQTKRLCSLDDKLLFGVNMHTAYKIRMDKSFCDFRLEVNKNSEVTTDLQGNCAQIDGISAKRPRGLAHMSALAIA